MTAQKILKTFMITLVLIGIALTVLNFTPKLYAPPAIFGTVTEINDPETLWRYYQKYGIEGLADLHLEGNEFCVDEESDCVIVF